MSDRIPTQPALPKPLGGPTGLSDYINGLYSALMLELSRMAVRINNSFQVDGTETMTQPAKLSAYAKSALPAAASWEFGLIYVTDETGGAVPAFSDGTNWRRVTDRAIVS